MSTRSALTGTLMVGLAIPAAPQDEGGPAAAMRREGLLETTPESLRTANYVLSKTFDRGVKDMAAYTYLAKLLLQHTLSLANQNLDQALDYKRAALRLTYNLAANTWPGWGDEEHPVSISDHQRRLGLEAAKLDVKLAAEAAPTVQRRSNSYWILGAHLIADGQYAAAVAAFQTCRKLRAEAGNDQGAVMAQGWIHLANTWPATTKLKRLPP